MSTSASPIMSSYLDSVRLNEADLITRLLDCLGGKLTAYLGGVRETRAVRQWAEGVRKPSSESMERLRLAFQAAGMIVEAGNAPQVVQAWFQGMNPQLEDRSPARVIREGDPHAVGPEVLAAARAFARVG
ncbi:hypothetical protein NBM05_05620 [Rothia sp. AR01]|uniref:Antitoxin Xre/MbcA/ParS-like toxin-binding domain-containing protein n=1 Tax=Rothia santali TaxID=2949643 RepID=A0A9X2HEV0_9MICC|nr:hypothetical protein [Rothia santali]MCP3425507.1 hypothetical protein [Rothia santali]